MQALLEVLLPVFLVLGAGYLAAWRGVLAPAAVDGLMSFAQTIALPCVLFRGIAQIDLAATFDWPLLVSFYSGALAAFALGLCGARWLFGRPWEDAIAIGFCALFSNSLLLGLPIMERAYGPGSLAPNLAIISLHAPFCYAIGLTAMEFARARTSGSGGATRAIATSMLRNGLVIGILLGFAVNLGGIPLPDVVAQAVDLVARSALPAALFALGGILYRYRPEGDAMTIAFVCVLSLVVHPLVVWIVGRSLSLDVANFRSAVLTAAMAPGVNAYIFANLYGVAKRVAASSVLVATGLSVLTTWVWLALLP